MSNGTKKNKTLGAMAATYKHGAGNGLPLRYAVANRILKNNPELRTTTWEDAVRYGVTSRA